MKKYLFIAIIVLSGCVAGCMSSSKDQIKTVADQYDAVNFDDGISLEEAKAIGQRELVKRNLVKIYDLPNPKVLKNVSDLPNYEKYWFISFKEKKISSIDYVFIAIIHRQTGRVKFSDDFQEDKRWIMEAALLGG